MSLTGHLRSSSSPVRAWFDDRLPHTREFAAEANREVNCGRTACAIPRREGADRSLVGDAVEYLLAAALWPAEFNDSLARSGARLLDLVGRRSGIDLACGERWQDARGRLLDCGTGTLSSGVLTRQTCADCLWLAAFAYIGRFGARGDIAPKYADPIWTEASVEDLLALGEAALEDNQDLGDRRPIYAKPEFAATRLLGGADADLIADGLLLDFKSNSPRGVVGRQELWQLAGYVLADYDDRYTLDHCGVAALRWRRRVVWDADGLLAALAGAPRALTEWRQDFRTMLEQVADQRQQRRVQTRARRARRAQATRRKRAN